ncbi:MAG TPA: hypothetical protein VGF48_02135 [Thermoanaerobaculia bacterium]|jgi:hypothetical protein
MARYIRKLPPLGSLGPTEERGFAVWAGYDIVGVEDDLSYAGLELADRFSEEELAARRVTTFIRVGPGDTALYEKLGIRRKS